MTYRRHLIITFAATISLLIAAFSVALNIFVLQWQFRQQVLDKGLFLAQAFAGAYRQSLVLPLENAVLYANIESMMERNSDLVYVYVYSAGGELLVGKSREGFGEALPIPSLEDIGEERIREVVVGGKPVSQCEAVVKIGGRTQAVFFIGFTREFVERQLDKAWRILAVILVVGLAVGVALAYWISGKLTLSLDVLTRAVKEIDQGNFRPEITLHTGDEFERLGHTLGKMGASIADKIEVIRRKNSDLSDRVVELTGLSAAGLRLSGKLDKKELSETLAEYIKEYFEAERAAVLVFDGNGARSAAHPLALKGFGKEQAIRMAEDLDIGPESLRWQGEPSHVIADGHLALPIYQAGRTVGVAVAAGKSIENALKRRGALFFNTLGRQIDLAFENATHYEEAVRDGLTRLYVQNYFKRKLDEFVAAGRPFAVMIIDLDFFKKVNDTYGHLAGDDVLRRVSGMIADTLTGKEIACRYGGEEFAAVLPEAELSDVKRLAEELRSLVQAMVFESEGKTFQCTLSIGLSFWPEDAQTGFEALKRADEALYYSKEHGRNRASVYRECVAPQENASA